MPVVVNMAEGWSGNKENLSGANLSSVIKTIPCRFFKQGKCIYGDTCRYLHEIENDPIPSQIETLNDQFSLHLSDWINAPEFVPSWSQPAPTLAEQDFPSINIGTGNETPTEDSAPMSYARAVDPTAGQTTTQIATSTSELCPYFLMGLCRYGEECVYVHGEVCELCGQPCLHPTNQAQRLKHNQDCMRQHQIDMEKSFAVARSRDKACGICMETIWEKLPSTKQRFGLLPNCSHCFCLDCIRKWRQEKQFENKIIRSCPECRVQSDFVCPSRYWCETKEEKEKLITDYKKALSNKACKYFNQGRGECPFGNRCFYQHALADGTKTDVGPPSGKLRRRRIGPDEEEAEFFRVLLWDFLEERESRYVVQLGLDLDDLDLFTSDSDDFDLSDDGPDLFFLH